MTKKYYKILKKGKIIQSTLLGKYAGWGPGKIFGRLDCKSGMRMKKENRVFFHTLEDAVNEGFRPCKVCRPINEEEFKKLKEDFKGIEHPFNEYNTLEEFYNRDKKK